MIFILSVLYVVCAFFSSLIFLVIQKCPYRHVNRLFIYNFLSFFFYFVG